MLGLGFRAFEDVNISKIDFVTPFYFKKAFSRVPPC